jgi:hypothetical protein
MNEQELKEAINKLINYLTDDQIEEIESVDNGLMEIRDLIR